ncbi:MAG: translocator protein [Candidatus Woesearchaeota archaeon]|nr:translocator protein [Candidatus Woesearchaeota archaeon]
MKYTKLIISILIPLVIGFLGSFFTNSSVNSWYTTLNKPSFNPPNWLFAPAWTILFILIGISFYLVWKENFGNKDKLVIGIYSIQLFLNLMWSFLFFGLKNPFLALIEIIVLWFVILANIIIFYRIKREAGLLLIPYILWVSFATVLNYFIFILN